MSAITDLRAEWEESNWQRNFTVDEIDALLDIAEAAEACRKTLEHEDRFGWVEGADGASDRLLAALDALNPQVHGTEQVNDRK